MRLCSSEFFSRAVFLVSLVCLVDRGRAETIWIEAEKPAHATMARHPWWYDKVQRDQFSGGDFISNWSADKAGEATYGFKAESAGDFDFWVRANPVGTTLLFGLNGAPLAPIDMTRAVDTKNIAENNALDVRFIAWIHVGKVKLKKGDNTVDFKMDSQNNHHGMIDCFTFTTDSFEPRGTRQPGQAKAAPVEDQKDWFAFDPPADAFQQSPIDLRSLNEKNAGDGGFIAVKGGEFVHSATGEPVRFWAVNGPPGDMKDPGDLRKLARLIAKRGVNLVRIHGPVYDDNGELDPAKVKRSQDVVEAMKAEGIYCDFSIYFPLFIAPRANNPWLKGYDGEKRPFAALMFNPDFQQQYRKWWTALLTTPDAKGKKLIDEPAVSSVEMQNEDSYFFWTFNVQQIPDVELKIIESQFGDWLKTKYGSIDAALAAWNGPREPRDNPAEGRITFRPHWNMFSQKLKRDQDTATFLLESQRKFYTETYQFIRGLGFKGLITASNWTTASQPVYGPLEKYSYTTSDYIDRHGYFSCNQQGDGGGWSIREGNTYADRDALKFDPEEPGKPKDFVNTIMDPKYDDKPSTVSEITFNRPNRYRSEAPLYYAAYGALQGSNGIMHFALDGASWTPKPGYFVQPWTVMSPAMMGQFPAAALIFRKRLVAEGDELVNLNLKIADIEALKGTPLAQDAAIDELRLKDVPSGTNLTSDNLIDPLVHMAGRTSVHFTEAGGQSTIANLAKYIDRKNQKVISTNGQLALDYRKGVLQINSPEAQGVCGDLSSAGVVGLGDLSVSSHLGLGNIVAVSLDGKPLATSKQILLQVMSEEKPDHYQTEPAGAGIKRIANLGQDPWIVKNLEGVVKFTRPDAATLKVTPLDLNGYPTKAAAMTAAQIHLDPKTVYYFIGD